ncbi:hypothetical protein pipiens_020316, partial [Culex pipiens pipiens]
MILPLLLTTFNEDRLSLEDLIAMFYKNPKWNFGLPEQPNTYDEDDFNEEWIIPEVPPHYKARWSSFAGIKVKGRVYRNDISRNRRWPVEKINGSLDGLDFLTLRKIISDTTRRYFWENGHTNAVFSKLLAGNESNSDNYGKDVLLPVANLTPKERTMAGKHVLSEKQLNEIFNVAQTMRACITKDHHWTTCSVKKGEVSIFVMAGYSDVVVLRHPEPAAVSKASHHCRKPLINAGDGIGEHPTQSLLDIFTIREEVGTVNGLTIIIVGDLKHDRTVHS